MVNRIEITENGDAEDAKAVVCARLTSPLLMPDNLIDLCAKCRRAIQYRPHVPKRPPKICFECALPIVEKEAAKGELVTLLTPQAAADIAAYLRKKSAN